MAEPRPNIGREALRRGLGAFRDADALERYRARYARAMSALPAPDEVRDVPTSLGTVHTARFGSHPGPPLVLFPGRSSAIPMWSGMIARLAAHRTVIALDNLGEPGLSVQTRRIRSAADHARWGAETLAGLGLDRAHLVGVSVGGWMAFTLVRHEPTRVASVALLEPAMTFGSITPTVLFSSIGMLLPFPRLRTRILSRIVGGADVSDDDEPVGRLVESGFTDFTARLPQPGLPTDPELAGVDRPVLVVLGGRSVIHDPRKAKARAERLLRDGEVELWPDASHNVTGEHEERAAERVLRFVDGVDARGAVEL